MTLTGIGIQKQCRSQCMGCFPHSDYISKSIPQNSAFVFKDNYTIIYALVSLNNFAKTLTIFIKICNGCGLGLLMFRKREIGYNKTNYHI